jgi:hypothetical protein
MNEFLVSKNHFCKKSKSVLYIVVIQVKESIKVKPCFLEIDLFNENIE